MGIQKRIRKYNEELHTHKFDDFEETGQFLQNHKLQKSTKIK
jgi:hypothetical protein